MTDLRKSSFVKQGVHPPDDRDSPKSKMLGGFGSGRVSGRTFGIGSFLNNYDLSVEQMAAVDPLPLLTPLTPFEESLVPVEDVRQQGVVEKWPCELPKTRQTIQERFPRKKDWMHDWAHCYYMVGDGGAKTKK